MRDWIGILFVIMCWLLALPGCANKQKMELALRDMLVGELHRQSARYKQKYVAEPCENADKQWDEMILGLEAFIKK